VSVELKSGGIVKSLDGFSDHLQDANRFTELLRECEDRKVVRPSSYGDVFHQGFRSPYVKVSVNNLFKKHFAGAWEHACLTGTLKGVWRKYDLNRAYYWAALEGLPDPTTFRWSTNPNDGGLYVVSLAEQRTDLPYPWSTRMRGVASAEEIREYGLPVKKIHSGVKWDRNIDLTALVAAIEGYSFSKRITQAYWGRWASHTKLEASTVKDGSPSKVWRLPNPTLNFVWSHLIVSRVKLKCWLTDPQPAHVFVDSLITHRVLPTGAAVGDWKLVRTYPQGVHIVAPGWYGPAGGPLEKHAGVKAA